MSRDNTKTIKSLRLGDNYLPFLSSSPLTPSFSPSSTPTSSVLYMWLSVLLLEWRMCVILLSLHCGYIGIMLLHCDYTIVTLLLWCYYTVVTQLLHCCYTVVTLLLHYHYTVITLLLHCNYTMITQWLHCCYTIAEMGNCTSVDFLGISTSLFMFLTTFYFHSLNFLYKYLYFLLLTFSSQACYFSFDLYLVAWVSH